MSLETAMAALNTATGTNDPAPTMPTNMANGGANTNTQATQEVKENAVDGLKTSEVEGEAVVPKVEETPAAPKIEEPISAKFSALAKKEKAILKRDAEAKAKEAAIAEREKALAEREARNKSQEELWEKNVWEALEAKGYSYQKLTDMILAGKTAPEKTPEDPIQTVQKQVESFIKEQEKKEQEKIAAQKKAEEDAKAAQAKAIEEARKAYIDEVDHFIVSNEKDYRLSSLYKEEAKLIAIDLVDQYYEQNKKVLSIKEATDLVEAYFKEEAAKITSRLKEETAAPAPQTKTVEEPRIQQTKTLSNTKTASGTTSQNPAKNQAEKMRRALAALNKS